MKGPVRDRTFAFPEPKHWIWERRGYLVQGQLYRVVTAFVDADGDEHPVDEEWEYLGGAFNKFYNEVEFWIRRASGEEWMIPLIWHPDNQQDVIEHTQRYIVPAR